MRRNPALAGRATRHRNRTGNAASGASSIAMRLGRAGATGIDIGSIFVAFVGSCVLIALLRLFSARSRA